MSRLENPFLDEPTEQATVAGLGGALRSILKSRTALRPDIRPTGKPPVVDPFRKPKDPAAPADGGPPVEQNLDELDETGSKPGGTRDPTGSGLDEPLDELDENATPQGVEAGDTPPGREAGDADPVLEVTPPPTRPAPEDEALAEMDRARRARAQVSTEDAQGAARRLTAPGSLDDFDLDSVEQINFDIIDTPADVDVVIARIADEAKGKIMAERRGIQTDDMVRALANDIGVQSDTIKRVMTRERGDQLLPEQVVAARKFLGKSAGVLTELAKRIASGQGVSDIDQLRFLRQIQLHSEFQIKFMGARAEAGRLFRAFGIPLDDVQGSIDPEALSEMLAVAKSGAGMDVNRLARQVVELADNPAKLNHFTRNYHHSLLGRIVNELFVSSILSGVKTHVVNGLSTAMFMPMQMVEYEVAAMLGRRLSKEDRVLQGEGAAMLFGAVSGIRDAMRLSWHAMKSGQSSDLFSKFDQPFAPAIARENFGRYGENGFLGPVIDGIGATGRAFIERVMVPMDEFFKVLAYRGDLARTAYRRANLEGEAQGWTPEQISDSIRVKMEEPPTEAIQNAKAAALYSTFQLPLGEKGRRIERALNVWAPMRLITPFIRTPGNIFKDAWLERTPIGLFSQDVRRTLEAGGPEAQLMRARMNMGVGLGVATATMAASGFITGGAPDNPEARALLGENWQPYSFTWVNDDGKRVWVSYARAEPLAFIIGAIADAVQWMQWKADVDSDATLEDEDKARRVFVAAVAGIVNNSMSKTFMSGMSEFFAFAHEPQLLADSYINRYAESMVPFSKFRRDVSDISDPIMRQAFDMRNRLYRDSGIWALPGQDRGEALPPMRDQRGRVRAKFGVINPFPVRAVEIDPVDEQLKDLMRQTNRVPLSRVRRIQDGVKLDEWQMEAFTNYSRNIQKLPTAYTSRHVTFNEGLTLMLSDPRFLKLGPDGQVSEVQGLARQFDEGARLWMAKNDPAYAAAAARKKQILNRARHGQYLPAGQ